MGQGGAAGVVGCGFGGSGLRNIIQEETIIQEANRIQGQLSEESLKKESQEPKAPSI